MSPFTAKLFVQIMIFPHLSYCITTWSQAGVTVLRPVYSLYKHILKALDKKPKDYHHCNILKKYDFLDFDNFMFYSDVCLMFKITHNLAPPPLVECLSCPSSGRAGRTRASIRGDWVPQFRRTAFGQSAFSIKVIGRWNSIPTHIRDSGSLVKFKSSLKLWLKETQKCNHL